MTGSGVVARAVVRAERRGRTTRCATLRSEPPLTVRDTPDGVHLVGTAAGPLGGDRLSLRVEVTAHAHLVVRSAAATLALPGARPGPSRLDVELVVAEGASLHWIPQPLVLASGCDHRVTVRVALAADAQVVFHDQIVLGRHDEETGSLLQRLDVSRAGRAVLRTELAIGARWPGAVGPAGVDDARVVAQVLAVGPGVRCAPVPMVDGVTGAVMEQGEAAVLVSILGRSHPRVVHAVRDVLDGITFDAAAALPT